MASLNKVLLIGNLTRDPELRYTPAGVAVVNLRLAVNRKFKDRSGEAKEETCFVTAVAWDRQAEVCNQYLQKGRLVFVEGRLQSRSWETPDGQKRSILEVRAERVQFLGGPKEVGEPGAGRIADDAGADSPSSEVKSDHVSWEEEESVGEIYS